MIPIRIRQVQRPPSAEKIAKNINFGVALGLTDTAKEGQRASQGALKGTFTLRGPWWQQGNKYGIKTKPAKRDDLSAEIRTNADWLEPHETGTDKKARGGRVAVPTENVRRNKRQIIAKAQRPSALRNKRTFVMQTKRGAVLFQRKFKGKRSHIVALYGLEQSVRIRRQSTFHDPIDKVVKRRLNLNVNRGLARAFATMK
jgi:hypothetical protein